MRAHEFSDAAADENSVRNATEMISKDALRWVLNPSAPAMKKPRGGTLAIEQVSLAVYYTDTDLRKNS